MASDLTMREAGQLLGVSHQRVKQLVDRHSVEAKALDEDTNDQGEMLAVATLMESLRAAK